MTLLNGANEWNYLFTTSRWLPVPKETAKNNKKMYLSPLANEDFLLKNLKSQLFFIGMHSVLSTILRTDLQMSARKILNFVLFMKHYSIWLKLKLVPFEPVNRLSVVRGQHLFSLSSANKSSREVYRPQDLQSRIWVSVIVKAPGIR